MQAFPEVSSRPTPPSSSILRIPRQPERRPYSATHSRQYGRIAFLVSVAFRTFIDACSILSLQVQKMREDNGCPKSQPPSIVSSQKSSCLKITTNHETRDEGPAVFKIADFFLQESGCFVLLTSRPAAARGFDLAKIESILRHSGERYLDTVTGRLIAVGRHGARLVIIPYEISRVPPPNDHFGAGERPAPYLQAMRRVVSRSVPGG